MNSKQIGDSKQKTDDQKVYYYQLPLYIIKYDNNRQSKKELENFKLAAVISAFLIVDEKILELVNIKLNPISCKWSLLATTYLPTKTNLIYLL